jgi:hypothetical protein
MNFDDYLRAVHEADRNYPTLGRRWVVGALAFDQMLANPQAYMVQVSLDPLDVHTRFLGIQVYIDTERDPEYTSLEVLSMYPPYDWHVINENGQEMFPFGEQR